MNFNIIEIIKAVYLPILFTVLFVIVYHFTNKVFDSQSKKKKTRSILKPITLTFIVIAGLISVLLAFPFSQSIKVQILNVVGIVLSAAIALNSTTFLGNIFAGLMNKTSNHFRIGDFIYIGNEFGKISDITLFHTEIQTQDRGLVTFSNIYIASNPVKVVRASGTIVSTSVSLGYDISRLKIENLLIEAAIKADLKEPFVFITELGDYSIVYKINGLLEDISMILTAKSKLNAMVLDELHLGKIEIVSPTFMNQRQVNKSIFIPQKQKNNEKQDTEVTAEDVFFEKAFKAENIEKKSDRIEDINVQIIKMKEDLKSLKTKEEKNKAEANIEKWESILAKTKVKIVKEKDNLDSI